MSPQAEHDVNGVSGDWNQFKKQLAAALLCAVYSFIVAFALMKGLMVVICVEIKVLRRVRAESSRLPPRHRRDAPDTLVDFHTANDREGLGIALFQDALHDERPARAVAPPLAAAAPPRRDAAPVERLRLACAEISHRRESFPELRRRLDGVAIRRQRRESAPNRIASMAMMPTPLATGAERRGQRRVHGAPRVLVGLCGNNPVS